MTRHSSASDELASIPSGPIIQEPLRATQMRCLGLLLEQMAWAFWTHWVAIGEGLFLCVTCGAWAWPWHAFSWKEC